MAITSLFGLIGYPLGHSFSKKYFTDKFEVLGLSASHAYTQFEIPSMQDFPQILRENPNLKGLNVTIPYKQQVISFLDEIDAAAERIGAVNTIKFLPDGRVKGFNSDYFGFQQTLTDWPALATFRTKSACVLGQGGAAKAVIAAIEDLGISVIKVSRKPTEDSVDYDSLVDLLPEIGLIVNTTPLGMHPHVDTFPPIPYEQLTSQHYLYDIVYNPLETSFLRKGIAQGVGGTHAGLAMLHGQAEKAWEIWNA
jgi:shikimate dehydrogenase